MYRTRPWSSLTTLPRLVVATLIVAGPVGTEAVLLAEGGELVALGGVEVPPHAVITARAAALMVRVIGRMLLMVNPDRLKDVPSALGTVPLGHTAPTQRLFTLFSYVSRSLSRGEGDIENAIRVVRKSVAGQLGRIAVATQLRTVRPPAQEDVEAVAVGSV